MAVAETMRKNGIATLRVDMYGHGKSGGRFEDHTLYKWLTNGIDVIDYIRTLDFVTDIYLCGHSQGGLTAALVGGMAPDLIKGLVLRAPAFMIPRGAREGCLLGFHFDPLHVPDAVEVAEGVTLGGNYIRTAQTLHVEEAMDRFSGPVLLMHGDQDDVVPPEDSIAASARYRNASLCMIPGETHHYDRFPETMETSIRDWLSKQR